MIIANGTIRFKQKTAAGIDPKTGYALKPESTWSRPYDCQILPKSQNNLAIVNNEHYRLASYDVLIDDKYPFHGEVCQLRYRGGKEIGEFSIRSIEHLRAVCQIRISV